MRPCRPRRSRAQPLTGSWCPERSSDLYRIEEWGSGYFGVSERGKLLVRPDPDAVGHVDLHELVLELHRRGVRPPVVVRFPEILRHRMESLRRTFDEVIEEQGYGGRYSCVYPLKVNQDRHVCEAIRDTGEALDFGLEAGSKPELLAALALTEGREGMRVVCNGFKDAEYVELAVLASKMGRNVVPVVEQAHELALIVDSAERHGVLPTFGIRAKLAATGVGRWAGSAGPRSKFGLTSADVVRSVAELERRGMLDGLHMLHCHMGSQLYDIHAIKAMASEMARVYVELRRSGAPVRVIDIGGGLGVDYDGTQSASPASVNYTLHRYATDVVHRIASVCDEAGAPHPDIVSESGRWLVSHSSVLVCEVVGTRSFSGGPDPDLLQRALSTEPVPAPLVDARDAYRRSKPEELLEAFADAEHALAEAAALFSLGHLGIVPRAACEELFWATGRAVLDHFGDDLPEHLVGLPERLADLYVLNLSVFQSLLDSWGVDQVFPVMPVHRLDAEPTRLGVLADITCDSDGRVDRFPAAGAPKATLELHEPIAGEPYYLGFFLTGAYQETLGDLHNLLGDAHAVHVTVNGAPHGSIDSVVPGDTVAEVLGYVQYDAAQLRHALSRDADAAVAAGRLTPREGESLRGFLLDGLAGYTYLE